MTRYNHPEDQNDAGLLLAALRRIYKERGEDYDEHEQRRNQMQLTEDEQGLLNHIIRWGSDGYPVRKFGRGWTWGPFRSIKGSPIVYKTKREATAAFEAYEQHLMDRKAGRL